MARNFTNRNQIRRPSRRHVGWDLAVVSVGFNVVPANSKLVLATVTVAGLSAVGPGTIVRTRGYFAVQSDQEAADETQVGSIGFGLVNSVAGTLGVTGLPGPSSEALWDGWFVHQFFTTQYTFETGIGFQTGGIFGMDIDSKAMRKFDQDQNIVVMVENTHATQGLSISLQARFLIKAG